jgi:hypothetical protein
MLGPAIILAMALAAAPLALAQNAQKAAKTPAAAAARHDITGDWVGNAGSTISNVGAMTAWGQEQFNANKPFNGAAKNIVPVGQSNDPFTKCDPMGFPRAVFFETRGIEFDPLPNKMLELFQYQKIWREIWMDGRALPKNVGGTEKGAPDPRYYGYSVGHWEGDHTLVVDTTGLDERTWLNEFGYPHSVEAHVQERFTRTDRNDLELTLTVDDPKLYTKPFSLGTEYFRWVPNQLLEERLCIPSEVIEYLKSVGDPAGQP